MKKIKNFTNVYFTILLIFSLVPSFAFGGKKALLIGINEYPYAEAKYQLFGCVNDVKLMKNILIKYYNFSSEEIKELINSNATRKNIIETFNNWLAKTQEGDLVVFFYSGHGTRCPDFNGDEDDGMDECFCPYDINPIGGDNIITDDEFATMLRQMKGREVVVIIDACYSGGMTRRVGSTRALEKTPATHIKYLPIIDYKSIFRTREFPRQTDEPEGFVFLSASKEDEQALEINESGKWIGGFTLALAQELRKHKVSYEKLFENAKKYMKDRLCLPHNPQLKPTIGDKIKHIAFVLPGPAIGTQYSIQPVQVTQTSQPQEQPESHKPPIQGTTIQPVVHPSVNPSEETVSGGSQFIESASEIVPEEKLLLVAIEPFKGTTAQQMREIKKILSTFSYIKVVQEGDYFDRLIRGELKNGRIRVRIINRIGDVIDIPETNTIKEIVDFIKPHLEYAYIVKQLVEIHNPSPTFEVNIWVNDREKRDFAVGDIITFNVRAEKKCYLTLLSLDSNGVFSVIFPNNLYPYEKPFEANKVYTIPDEEMKKNFLFKFQGPACEETVKIIATTKPLNLDKLGLAEFQAVFIPGKEIPVRSLSPTRGAALVRDLLQNIRENKEKDEEFEWSEDTIVIRTYEKRR